MISDLAYCLTHSKKIKDKLYVVITPPIYQHAKCSAKIRHCKKDNCFYGWCETHIKQKCVGDKEDYTEYVKLLGAAQLAKDIDLLTDQLFARLDQMPHLLEVDHVGLENQLFHSVSLTISCRAVDPGLTPINSFSTSIILL